MKVKLEIQKNMSTGEKLDKIKCLKKEFKSQMWLE